MSSGVQFLAKQQLNFNFCYCLVGDLNQANLNVKQEVYRVHYADKFRELEKFLKDPEIKSGRTIVFMNQRRRCQTFSIRLGMEFGTIVEAIHGDRHQRERENALDRFKKGE